MVFTLLECIGYDMLIRVLRRVNLFLMAKSYFSNCLAAKNNGHTRHFAKILFHLACYLQESMSTTGVPPLVYEKAVNAVYISSVFLKHLIESVQGDSVELYLSLDDNETIPKDVLGGIYNTFHFRFRFKICKQTKILISFNFVAYMTLGVDVLY